jgi:DnaA family protein
MQQLILDLAPFNPQTFGNFIPGKNAEVLHALSALCAGRENQLVYLWGARGSGKSHLLNAAVEATLRRGGGAQHFEGAVFCDLTHCDVVAADAVEALDEDAQSALFLLYNERREAGRATLVAGAMPPAVLPLRDDLRSRLAWGLVYEVRVLSDEEKASALEAHAKARGFRVSSDVVHQLLARGPRDLPTLFATLDALDRYSLETKRAINVNTLRELMRRSA